MKTQQYGQQYGLIGAVALVAVLFFALGLLNPRMTQVNAQVKAVEICDDKVDNDGDDLVDGDDPDCKGTGIGCSPGYWKNHLVAFNKYCGRVDGWTCSGLWTAITCKGSDASCRRSEAAAALNKVSGCTE